MYSKVSPNCIYPFFPFSFQQTLPILHFYMASSKSTGKFYGHSSFDLYYQYVIVPSTSSQTMSHFMQCLVETPPLYMCHSKYFIHLLQSFPPPDTTNSNNLQLALSQLLYTNYFKCIIFCPLAARQIKLISILLHFQLQYYNTTPLYPPWPL